ncbi:MAG: protein kinase [Candidatus Schekmanbacteria bacterium]|nr:protein kinase [Candidatus Schekmanbacteria bacterium]
MTTVPASDPAAPLPPEPADWRFPERLGPFVVERRLGQGGMGIVFRGRHERTGEAVALKTLRAANEHAVASIRREIRALSRVSHPGIVRIVAHGVDGGLPWFAMELVEGQTLADHVNRFWDPLAAGLTPISAAQLAGVLTVARRICEPLAHLHGEGLVHRDLKLANVLIREGDRPVLVDLGLVGETGGVSGREALVVAETGGTLAFMAPEQIRRELVDARADLYALGCILFRLLTGDNPFRTLQDILSDELCAIPPSALVDGIPEELDRLVLALLAKRPEHRLGHASDVAKILEELGAGSPSYVHDAAPRSYLYRPQLVGRDAPLQRIGELLARCGRRSGAVMLVGGESGVGKTRLAMEVAREAQLRGIRVLTGESSPAYPAASGSAPFASSPAPLQPLQRLLESVLDCLKLGPREAVLPFFEQDNALVEGCMSSLSRVAASSAESVREGAESVREGADAVQDGVEAAGARLQIAACAARLLAALASRRPLFLFIDDLQWADETTIDVLELLVGEGWVESTGLLVLATYRADEVSPRLKQLLSSPRVTCYTLDRLDPAAVAEMAAGMLATRIPEDFARFLAEQSEGNPFFVAEYLRSAVAEGLLHRDGAGRWLLGEAAATEALPQAYRRLQMPTSIGELVVRRYSRLPAEARAVLDAAAVLGRQVAILHVFEISRLTDEAMLDGITELIRRGVLEDGAPGTLRFAHDQYREAAYRGIDEQSRRELHWRAASAIERWTAVADLVMKGGDTPRVEGMTALAAPEGESGVWSLGDHWRLAGNLDRAFWCYRNAARAAARRFATELAARLFEAALHCCEHGSPEWREVRDERDRLTAAAGHEQPGQRR